LSNESPQNEDYSRELSIGQSFSRSFDLARKTYLQLLPIFAGFGLLAALAAAAITQVTPTLSLPSDVSGMTQAQILQAAGDLVRYIEYLAANFLVTSVILYFAVGVGIWRMGKILGQNQKLVFTLPSRLNFVSLAVTTFLAVVILEISAIIVVGPLLFGTMFYLCLAASVLEGKSALGAFGRARQLISGKWGKTFVVFIGTQIVVYIGATLVSDIVGQFTSSTVVVNAVQNFIMGLELPLVSATMVILYLSYRHGQERLMQKPPSLYDNLRPQPMGMLGSQKFCSACGSSVSADEKFCHNCGTALSTQQ